MRSPLTSPRIRRRKPPRFLVAAAAAALATLVWAGTAFGATISSAGPLHTITISPDLNCDVRHVADTQPEFFGATACGTLVATGGTLYGPASIPAGGSATPRTAFTQISQSAVLGSGTAADPFRIVTVVDLGTSNIRLTQTDSYVVGQESYRTDVQLSNTGGGSASGIVYRAGDCFLQNDDRGFGDPGPAVACRSAVDPNATTPVPGSRIIQWFPLTAGSNWYEAFFSQVWAQIGAQLPFPNTCRCTEFIDNGAGLSWNFAIAAAGSATFSHLTTFSPLGLLPLTTTKTADSATSPGGSSNGYTITITNPNVTAVTLDTITDTLPAGFSYTAGSTTGATTADPSIAGQMLTWSGSFNVAAGGTISLHFNVTVATAPGTYLNEAGGSASGFTVAPTGPTAPIVVTQSDTTRPTCVITAKIAGPPTQLQVTVRDTGSGLASILVTKSINAVTVVPPFAVGTTDPVVVTATKVNQSQGSTIELRVTDVAGNVTVCDPVVTLSVREAGQPATETYSGIPQAESKVTIVNGDPGVNRLDVTVNDKTWKLTGLKANQELTLDVASAMLAGDNNTITLTAHGKPKGSVLVVISD